MNSFGLTPNISIRKRLIDKNKLLPLSISKQTINKIKSGTLTEEISSSFKGQLGEKQKLKKGVKNRIRDSVGEIEGVKETVRENLQPHLIGRDSAAGSRLSFPDVEEEEEDAYKPERFDKNFIYKIPKKEAFKNEKLEDENVKTSITENKIIVPNSWEEFKKLGLKIYQYRRFKNSYLSRLHESDDNQSSRSRTDGQEEGDDLSKNEKKKHNLLETPMKLKFPLTVVGLDDNYKKYPGSCVKYTDSKPRISYSFNPVMDRSISLSRSEIMESLTEDIKEIVDKFLEMEPVESTKEEPVESRTWYKTREFMVSHLDKTTDSSDSVDELNFYDKSVKVEPEDYSEGPSDNEDPDNFPLSKEENVIAGLNTAVEVVNNRKTDVVENVGKIKGKELIGIERGNECAVGPKTLNGKESSEHAAERQINPINFTSEGMLASEYEQFIKTIEDRLSEQNSVGKSEDLDQISAMDSINEWSRTASFDRYLSNSGKLNRIKKKIGKSSRKSNKGTALEFPVDIKKKTISDKKRKRKRSASTSSDSSTTSSSSSSSSTSSSSSSSSCSSSSSSSTGQSSSSSSSSTSSSSSSTDSSSESSSTSSSSNDSILLSDSRKRKTLKIKLKKKEVLKKKQKKKQKDSKKVRQTIKKIKTSKNEINEKNKSSLPIKEKIEKRKDTQSTEARRRRLNRNLIAIEELYFPSIPMVQDLPNCDVGNESKKNTPNVVSLSNESPSVITFDKPKKRTHHDATSAEGPDPRPHYRSRPPTKRHFNLDLFHEEKSNSNSSNKNSNSNSEYCSPLPGRKKLIDYDFSSDDSEVKLHEPKCKDKEIRTAKASGTDDSFEIYSPTADDNEEEEEGETERPKPSENVSSLNSSHIDESSQLVSFGVNSASQEARMLDIPLPPPKNVESSPITTQANLTTSFHNILQQSPSSPSVSPTRKLEGNTESSPFGGKSGARLTFGKQMVKLKQLNIFSGEDSDSETCNKSDHRSLESGLSPFYRVDSYRSQPSEEIKSESRADHHQKRSRSRSDERNSRPSLEKPSTDEDGKDILDHALSQHESALNDDSVSPEKKSRWDVDQLPSNVIKNDGCDAGTAMKKKEDNCASKSYDKSAESRADHHRNRSRSRSNERKSRLSMGEVKSRNRRYPREKRDSREKRRGRDRSRDRSRRRSSRDRRRSPERSSHLKRRSDSPHRSKLSPFSSKLKKLDSRFRISPNSGRYMYDKSGGNLDFIEDYSTLANVASNPTVDSQNINYITSKPSDNSYDANTSRPLHVPGLSPTREKSAKRYRSPSYDEPCRRSPEYDKDSTYYRCKSPPQRRRPSPPNRRGSPPRRRSSPERKRNYSPYRWESPNRRSPSPGKGRRSPSFRRYSPGRRRDIDRENYPDNSSFSKRSLSPKKRRSLSPQKMMSPYISEDGKRDGLSRFTKSPNSHMSPVSNPSGDISNDWKWNYQSNIQNESNFSTNSSNNQSGEFSSQSKKLIKYQQNEMNDYQMSLADSTISDSELTKESSPKRLSLDERLQMELGESNMPKDDSANYANYYYQSDVNESMNYYHHPNQYPRSSITASNLIQPPTVDWDLPKPVPNTQVVQVGNMLQVVPTEITPNTSNYISKPKNASGLNKAPNIVQVGNVLQVVPRPEIETNEDVETLKPQSETAIPPETLTILPPVVFTQPPPGVIPFRPVPPPAVGSTPLTPAQIVANPPPPPPPPLPAAATVNLPVCSTVVSPGIAAMPSGTVPGIPGAPVQTIPVPQVIVSAIAASQAKANAKLLKLEEKERRRKEKELRRRRREQKVAKRLKRLKAAEEEANSALESLKSCDTPPQVAPIPILPSPDKGILVSSGFRDTPPSGSESRKGKSVSFADGIRPGYGSSPSGGEEHPLSPPPTVRKKAKKKKKRKVKVRIVRIENNKNDEDDDDFEEDDDEEEEDDDLSPPPPPPGTPPPEAYFDFTAVGRYIYPQPYTGTIPVATLTNDDKVQQQIVLPLASVTQAAPVNYGAPPPPPPPVATAVMR